MSLIDWFKRFIDKQDYTNFIEPPGLGVSWLWKLPDTHPFFQMAVIHDKEYDYMIAGTSQYPNSNIPDYNFYRGCVAECSTMSSVEEIDHYIDQARLFYQLIHLWGKFRWKK